MNAPSDKDYIDARYDTVNERVNSEMRLLHTEMAARFEKVEQRIAAEGRAIRDEVNLKLAQMEANIARGQQELLKGQNDLLKWIVGALIATAAISISAISVILTQATPRSAAPIVIYAPPAQPPTAPR